MLEHIVDVRSSARSEITFNSEFQITSMHQEAEQYLLRKDRILAKVIREYSPCTLKPHTKYFDSLCSAIISQQLSVKVAATIEKRFRALFASSKLDPKAILELEVEQMRSVGLSAQKAKYMHSLAEHFAGGHLNTRTLKHMSDAEIIEALTAVHGIGKWTAEMFLIFTMGRPDVFSLGDYGLRTAVAKLYGCATNAEILAQSEKWAPYRSVASWYLWRSLENKD